jgi:hypothetical protein
MYLLSWTVDVRTNFAGHMTSRLLIGLYPVVRETKEQAYSL